MNKNNIILGYEFPQTDIKRGRVYVKFDGDYIFFANFWTEMDKDNKKFYQKIIFNRDAKCFEINFPSAKRGMENEDDLITFIFDNLIKLGFFDSIGSGFIL